MTDIDGLIASLGAIAVETQPQKVRRRSRDFYWYSPVLKRELDHVTADLVITPADEGEVIAAIRACYAHDVPLTVRGGGTGNYGQAMPLHGGAVLDLSEMNAIREISLGRVRVQAGAKISDIDDICRRESGQELRLHPSTHKTGTIGGYIAGGSSGIGSITWGLLRDRGNILGARVVTMEGEPRILELRGADIQKVNHAYGTNGVITELAMPLAPAWRWHDLFVVFDDFATSVRFADALAREDAILKKLVAPLAAPIGNAFLRPDIIGRDESAVALMIADIAMDAFRDLLDGWPGRIVHECPADGRLPGELPVFEYTWNHTTLHALKHDRTITYLQILFPAPDHVEKVRRMSGHFGDELLMHLEFVRFSGEIACFGLPIVRYTDDNRLNEIIAYLNENGCPVFNPHACTLEEGGMKRVDPVQLAFKREADPKGLLNPGKMLGWDNPDFDESADRAFLYDG
ncbi:MAG: FAD-binding oxidoreductase [Geminicoccaceae bacterium]|nr:FAD-binding oxidoreductase [Geminicoccaceae bacterium]MCB9944827.1 FAD-binding oxidoreductase [Geminicoccaceae bacterium]